MDANALMSVAPVLMGERLAAARRARGLTQAQAAEAIGVARTTVTAMEQGVRRPRASELVELARLYGRQLGDLLRPAQEGQGPGFLVQFRAVRGNETPETSTKRERDIQRFEDLCRWYVELEQMLGDPLPQRFPPEYDVSGPHAERSVVDAAIAERLRLGLGDGPIGDLWGLLEADVGLRIFAISMQDGKIAGMYVATQELGGCIAINAKHPAERQHWTLAHEYFHVLADRFRPEITVLQSGRVPQQERLADLFARHFLMPASGLTRRFLAMKRAKDGPVTPGDILALAHLYKVSFQAMILHLEELDLLKGGTWDSLLARGFKPDTARKLIDLPDHNQPHTSLPFRYETLAARAFEEGLISEGQLARMLDTDRVSAALLARARATDEQPADDGEWRQVTLALGQPLREGR